MRTSSTPSFHASEQSRPFGGAHELGQNFLVDQRVIDRVIRLADRTSGPIVEIGAGSGALTVPLARLGRPLTALEIDPHRVSVLRRSLPRTRIERADALTWSYPTGPHVIVGNLPFHLTTALLRSLLARRSWTDAIVLTQWEVARRRCGVGGGSLLTAQWAPWYEFALARRVPATAFRPVPQVDVGLFTIRRRETPLVPARDQRAFQAFAASVFQGRGSGLPQVIGRASPRLGTRDARAALRAHGIDERMPPSRLSAAEWASIWEWI